MPPKKKTGSNSKKPAVSKNLTETPTPPPKSAQKPEAKPEIKSELEHQITALPGKAPASILEESKGEDFEKQQTVIPPSAGQEAIAKEKLAAK